MATEENGAAVDIAAMMEAWEHDLKAVLKMAQRFNVMTAPVLERLTSACESGDWTEVRDKAHQLKGGGKYVYAADFIEACQQLHTAVDEGHVGQVEDLVAAVVAHHARVSAALDEFVASQS